MSRAIKKLVPILILIGLVTPVLVFAADFNWLDCVQSPPTCAAYGITNLLASVGARLVALAAFLTKVAFQFTTNVINSPVVSQGFQITLTLANLGFVIGIIVIAIATIFRSQTYGIKKLLTSLVAMAILVNFGLVISGVLINFSDQLTTYFLNAFPKNVVAGDNTSAFVDSIVSTADPQGLFFDSSTQDNQGVFSAIVSAVTKFVGTDKNFAAQFTGLLFTAIFTFILALAVGVVGIMLLLRYFWLTFLLIMLPLAWLSWVFPALKKHWNDWWQHFIKWTFFAPVLMFFLYLAITIAQGNYIKTSLTKLNTSTGVTADLAQSIGRGGGFLENITKQIIVVGLIFGGLIAANKMGIGLAGAAINGAKSAGKWVQGATKRGVARNWERTKDKIRTAGKNAYGETIWKRAGFAIQGIPGLRTAGQRIAGFEKIPEDRTKAIEEFRKKNLDQLTDQGLTDYANSRATLLSLEEKAAVAREVAKRNLINARPDGRGGMVGGVNNFDTKYLPASERMNTLDDILKNRPELILQTQRRMVMPPGAPPGTPPVPETDAQMIARAMRNVKPGDMADINDKSLGDAGDPMATTDNQIYAVLSLGNSHLGNLVNNGSYAQQKAVKNTIGEAYTRYHAGALTLSTQQASKLDSLYNYVTNPNNINWQYI
jgi:hypothetical protein